MADTTPTTTQLAVEHRSDTSRLARERLLWAVRPFGFIGLVLWVLTPGVSAEGNLSAHCLQGFLLGAAYGLLVYGEQLKDYLQFRLEGGRDYKNRLPGEFYWGVIEKRLR
ncbi:MAG TPA: hypothetical protein VHP58_03030 [Alphaproteobacteria bacterium]|nr:hypothetical protein [Alphaproteobacteria bacterium]